MVYNILITDRNQVVGEDMNIRKFKNEDELPLAKIIRDTWDYKRLSSNPDVCLLMGKIYLYSCLVAQNFQRIAELDNTPIGIIMGCSNDKPNEDVSIYKERLEKYYDEMMSYPEGKAILEVFSGFEKLDKEMLAEIDKKYDGELVFFVTDVAHRGEHVGTKLYNCLIEDFKQHNCKNFYVYTDASCNFGFYEHQGFIRMNKRLHEVNNYKLEFYVYEKCEN